MSNKVTFLLLTSCIELGMGYVVFLGLRLMYCFTRMCNVLRDFQSDKNFGIKIRPARSEVADNSWVLLIKKESALDLQHIIMVTYMRENFTIVKWENENLNYALLLMHLEFIL